jgi:hypothetical protein
MFYLHIQRNTLIDWRLMPTLPVLQLLSLREHFIREIGVDVLIDIDVSKTFKLIGKYYEHVLVKL